VVNKMSKGEFMFKELSEGPRGVINTLEQARDEVLNAKKLVEEKNLLKSFIIGSGTSFHASVFLQMLLTKFTDLHVAAIPASEFKEWTPLLRKDYFLIGYSQSGESSDIVEAVKIANDKGILSISITNTPGSTLTKISTRAIVTRAGEEKAVAATKTFDVQLAAALMLTYSLTNKDQNKIRKAAQTSEKVLQLSEKIKEIAEKYKESSNAFTLGRGLAYPIALEAALKLKEAAMIHSEGFAVREFLHGPVQLVDENTPVLLFVTSEEGLEESIKALQKIKQYNAPVIYVGPESDKAKEYCTDFIEIEKIDDELMPIPLVKTAQLFAYHISVLRGLNPDKPTKLSKVVTY